MKDYTIKFNFQTAKAGRGAGQIIGKSGGGHCDITADVSLDELKEMDLNPLCYQSIKDHPKVKKMGNIISIEVLEINPLN